MLNKQEFQNIIKQYPLDKIGHKRSKYLNKLIPLLKRKEILILKGIRRSGKSTLIKQLINYLLNSNVNKKNILYVNFDDYNFLPYLNLDLLDFILKQLNLKSKSYLFLDEIQRIPNFESWLRTHYERGTNVKFVISGSTSTLLSKELGTVLTGRNLAVEIFPLDYSEFKEFSDKSFEEFLTYGGFPEIVLEKNIENKRALLRGYVSDIINKDILEKNKVKDSKQFMYFTQFIFKNPGIRISINKLSKQISLSKETVKNYLTYLIESYLIFEVPFFSYSAKSKFIASNIPKYYIIDNGLYLVNTTRNEKSKQTEAIIAQHLFRENKEIFYWKGKNEVDFIINDNAINTVSSIKIPERELLGLTEIKTKIKNIKRLILLNPTKTEKQKQIELIKIKDFIQN